eukprot:gnl/MRDRNA2_/MRDRNA2_97784_c0_seq1.p1 gnl/MRDRNA2_/MRDRNA2_97784_c0~~gnl/MRDRNA2_/MRDRNA2_97784_c0_seq1.p1  ORF type:complete len:1315 (-),score=327.76 gnl/MRDRNA2_/MRDRNA2_97784_c0_seq1:123-3980(-)
MVQAPLDTCDKVKALTSFKACATPSGTCDLTRFEKLVDDVILPDKTSALKVFQHLDTDKDGTVHRADFLGWLFDKPADSREVFGEALKARISELLSLEIQPLPQAWAQDQDLESASDGTVKHWWGGHAMAFCTAPSLAEQEALHIQRVLEAGLDANAVPFPKAPSDKKAFQLIPTSNTVVQQPDDTPFTLPGSASINMELTSESEKEIFEMWLAGLARNAEDLRCEMHNDSRGFETELVPWLMIEADVIKEDVCTEAQLQRIAKKAKKGKPLHPAFPSGMPSTVEEDDSWYLRSEAKSDTRVFDTEIEMWPVLEMDAIATDRCTDEQICLIEKRKRRAIQGLPSQAQVHQRRVDLAKALGSFEESNVGLQPAFLMEVFPTLEREAALAEMKARWARDKARALFEYDELAKQGEAFTVWPQDRCWPQQPAVWTHHAAWFAMWREKAPRPSVLLPAKTKEVKLEAPKKLERSNSESSLASWQALSEVSWQDAGDAEEGFEDMLLKLSDADIGKLKISVAQQIADAEQDLKDALSLENDKAVVDEIDVIKADCEKDLAAALPALEAAVKALDCLSKGDIGEVKAMNAPPAGVKLATEALCLMFSVKPRNVKLPDGQVVKDFWEPSKKELLGDPRLLDRMQRFDKDNIPETVIEKLLPYCAREDFNPDVIKKASIAAMSICMWVRALVTYHQVAKEVAPKREALAAAEKKLVCTDEILDAKRQAIQEMQEKQDLVLLEEARRGGEAAMTALQEARNQKLQDQLKVDLAEAKPRLDALKNGMQKATDGLSVKDFQELKALGKPPYGVEDAVAASAFLVKGESLKKMDWSICHKIMSNPGALLLQLKAFDAEAPIPLSILRKVRSITQKEHFNVEKMRSKSAAAAGLVDWALNVLEYNELHQKVLPLMKASAHGQVPAAAVEMPRCEEQMKATLPREMVSKTDVTECLNGIGKSCIQELKCLGKPPLLAVEACIACMYLLKNVEECDWKDCQKVLLADPGNFLKEARSVDIDKIPKTALSKCSLITQKPDFNADNVKKTSMAAGALAAWVISVMKYHNYGECDTGPATQVHQKINVRNTKVNATSVSTSANFNCYLCKGDIVELKSLHNPPVSVKSVLKCVQILLGKDEDWTAGKRMLSDATFLKTLLEFRREDATHDQIQRVQVLLDTELQDNDVILKVSKAAYGLLRWVRATVSPEVLVAPEVMAGISLCPQELELDGELRTALPTPTTTPASTQGSDSNANTPSAIARNSGMVHEHLTQAGIAVDEVSKAAQCDMQNKEESGKKCVIS